MLKNFRKVIGPAWEHVTIGMVATLVSPLVGAPAVLLPALQRALAASCRPGALILDLRGGFGERVRMLLRDINRIEDFVPIDARTCWTNPLRDIERDPQAVTDWLLALASSPDMTLTGSARRFLSAGCLVAKISGVGRIENLSSIGEALTILLELSKTNWKRSGSGQEFAQALESFESAASVGVLTSREQWAISEYVDAELRSQLPSQLMESIASVRALLAPLVEGERAALFCPGLAPEFCLDSIFDRGAIAVADGEMPPVHSAMLVSAFHRCRLGRANRVFFDGENCRPINQNRPVLLINGYRRSG